METPGLASLWFFWIWPAIALCWYDQRQRYNFSWTVCEAVRDSLGDKRDFIKTNKQTNLNYLLNWVPLMPVIYFDIYSGSLKPIHVRSDLMFLLHVSIDAHSQVFLRKPGVLQFFAPITLACVNKTWLLRAFLLPIHPAAGQSCEDCDWHILSHGEHKTLSFCTPFSLVSAIGDGQSRHYFSFPTKLWGSSPVRMTGTKYWIPEWVQ